MRSTLTLVLLLAVSSLVLASADAGQGCNTKTFLQSPCDPTHCEQLCIDVALQQGFLCRPDQGNKPCFTSQSECVLTDCNCTTCFVKPN